MRPESACSWPVVDLPPIWRLRRDGEHGTRSNTEPRGERRRGCDHALSAGRPSAGLGELADERGYKQGGSVCLLVSTLVSQIQPREARRRTAPRAALRSVWLRGFLPPC